MPIRLSIQYIPEHYICYIYIKLYGNSLEIHEFAIKISFGCHFKKL